MSILCPQCDTQNPDGSAFCKKCGCHLTQLKQRPTQTVCAQESHTHSFPKRGMVLDTADPFPDTASKYKGLNFLAFLIGIIALMSTPGNGNIMGKLVGGFFIGLILAGITHFAVVNMIASFKVSTLSFHKYWLPYPIIDGELARKISASLHQNNLQIRLNPGITGGMFIGDENLAYQVTLNNEKGYFEVFYRGRAYLSTYLCMIRDVPRIVYTIQQAMIAD